MRENPKWGPHPRFGWCDYHGRNHMLVDKGSIAKGEYICRFCKKPWIEKAK